jgi:hypothetical protein
VDWSIQRVMLADRMGWTLDYIDSLPADDLAAVLGVLDGHDKAKRDLRSLRG